ncbi:hypothetical protein GBM96_11595 [Sutterella seckii]|uniref:Uncharacterized protein n=1 Tax=Sutterella seckii TaxID=1944635 RepID=A0AAI9SAT1_9BURK|nr:hypothetical protein GBM96_11595 [Sutterella seckii]
MRFAKPQKAAPRRKPGRPKGSKNKKTLEREAREARIAQGKRGPGRPRGSKNKPKPARKDELE